MSVHQDAFLPPSPDSVFSGSTQPYRKSFFWEMALPVAARTPWLLEGYKLPSPLKTQALLLLQRDYHQQGIKTGKGSSMHTKWEGEHNVC